MMLALNLPMPNILEPPHVQDHTNSILYTVYILACVYAVEKWLPGSVLNEVIFNTCLL